MLVAVSDGATGVWRGTYPPLFESMGLVISPNLQAHAYGARERPPVSPDFCVPPPHLQTPGSVTGCSINVCYRVSTNLTEQISRRFQEGFQEKSRTCLQLLRPAMQCTESTTFIGTCDDELQPTLIMHNMGPWQR